ncbi:hypothetical protein LPMP_250340 [Leishmania panamensis]|uniref:Uncharacterized protein n=1 Tax=Leishmania panamensis TaxID=5679 RepID=A0A088RUF1_LEIPA|nr:hypothetical protein LPMP_250340 [Leishmania panamensis]AIN98899.1 hypothetical protein LPMP_250340 [Leishmania panamensis]
MRSGSDGIPWSYSIHVHYTLDSVQGWPKIAIQLWQLDDYGCQDIGGYGTAYLPTPRCGWMGGWVDNRNCVCQRGGRICGAPAHSCAFGRRFACPSCPSIRCSATTSSLQTTSSVSSGTQRQVAL